jgi:hypothetical protein
MMTGFFIYARKVFKCTVPESSFFIGDKNLRLNAVAFLRITPIGVFLICIESSNSRRFTGLTVLSSGLFASATRDDSRHQQTSASGSIAREMSRIIVRFGEIEGELTFK